MPRRFRRSALFAAILSLAGLAACDPDASTTAERLALDSAVAVRIVEPVPCGALTTAGGPVNVPVRFEVANWVYPAVNKGVALYVDGSEPFAVVEGVTPVLLSGITPGRHRIAVCPVTKSGATGTWTPLAACACDVLTVDVALTGCSLTVPDPMTGDPECDPATPASTCCVDQNPCSVESCDASSGTPTCAFQSVAPDCCLSDLDCSSDQFCHLLDDPASVTDDALAVNRCAPCAACPEAGATCPAVCGACPACEAEGVCGGGVCPAFVPPPDLAPEDPNEVEAAPEPDVADLSAGGEIGFDLEVEPDSDAPGYVVEVSPGDDATDTPLGDSGCALGLGARRATGGWLMTVVLVALALAARARRAEVSPRGSRSGSSRSSRPGP